MSNKARFKLNVNWLPRLMVFGGVFLLTYLLYTYLFDEELSHALFMSVMISLLQTLFIQPGIDHFYISKHFKKQAFISTAYIRSYCFLFYSKVMLDENYLTLLTSQWNVKNNCIQVKLDQIESFEKSKFLGVFNKGLLLKTTSGETIKVWISDIEGFIQAMLEEQPHLSATR